MGDLIHGESKYCAFERRTSHPSNTWAWVLVGLLPASHLKWLGLHHFGVFWTNFGIKSIRRASSRLLINARILYWMNERYTCVLTPSHHAKLKTSGGRYNLASFFIWTMRFRIGIIKDGSKVNDWFIIDKCILNSNTLLPWILKPIGDWFPVTYQWNLKRL